MTSLVLPDRPLSIWQPVHLGADEMAPGRQCHPGRAEHAHRRRTRRRQVCRPAARRRPRRPVARLPPGPHRRQARRAGPVGGCAERFVGPSIDDAIDTMRWLQGKIDERTELLLQMKKRKVTPDLGWPVYLVPVDELAYFSATVGTSSSRRRSTPPTAMWWPAAAPPASSPWKPPSAPPRTSSPPRCGTCSATGGRSAAPPKPPPTPSSGHGWASKGYTAEDIDPQARGVSWLRAEDGIPRRIKAAYLSDDDIITLAEQAANLRRSTQPATWPARRQGHPVA